MMKDIILIVSSVLISAVAQLLLKQGMTNVGRISNIAGAPSKIISALLNPLVLTGLAVFGMSAIFWLVVLSRVKLNVAYPMVSLGYVAVVLFSWLILKEPVKPTTIIGCATVVLGIFLISRGM